MAKSCLIACDNPELKKVPINIFNFQTYNILKHGAADEVFKRKRKSLILKSKSVNSISFSHSLGKDKPNKSKSRNSKRLAPGFVTPPSYLNASVFAPGHKPPLLGANMSASNFQIGGGFLTRPKKSKQSKIEKEIEEISDSLKMIRKEVGRLRHLDALVPPISAELVKQHKSHSISLAAGTKETDSNAATPLLAKKQRVEDYGHLLLKKSNTSKSQIKLITGYKSEDGSDGSSRADSTKAKPRPKSNGEGLVKKLFSHLTSNSEKKKKIESFIERLIPEQSPTKKEADSPEPQSTLVSLKSALTSLLELTAELSKKKQPKKPVAESKAIQTDQPQLKPISFGNINLSKTIEEYIKKVIIESKSVKYTEKNLEKYFEDIADLSQLGDQSLSDTQKQALYKAIYTLLYKHLLIEVTLEMIKDSGVNVHNLFQFTFSRLSLDYEKYVQFENNRDQDLSARTVFEGDLDCSLEDDAPNQKDMLLAGLTNYSMPNHFPLEFYKLQSPKENESSEEHSTQK